MARTKQTARKSSGGKAPRKVMASTAARSFREEMTNRQNADWSPTAKKISYINYENMFNSYLFAANRAQLGGSQEASSSGTRTRSNKGQSPATPEKDFAVQFSTATTLAINAPGGLVIPLQSPNSAQTTGKSTNPSVDVPEGALKDHWLCMQPMSKFDGDGLSAHGRPRINLAVALDVSGSMACSFDSEEADDGEGGLKKVPASKISVAKNCLLGLIDQLQRGDGFGLVTFNSAAHVVAPLKSIVPPGSALPSTTQDSHDIEQLQSDIEALKANGMTSLSAGMTAATKLFDKLPENSPDDPAAEWVNGEKRPTTNRIYFLTDLNSTMDSMNDELALLKQVRDNASKGIYTTIVGYGTDMNQKLIRQLSEIVGCKYCSVDSSLEFLCMLHEDFGYEITMVATDVRMQLLDAEGWTIDTKGYGSPEVAEVKKNTAVLSCEFAMGRTDKWESKGGVFLFKLVPPKDFDPSTVEGGIQELKVALSWRDLMGHRHEETRSIKLNLNPNFETYAIRKAVAIVRYVDLHNQYIAFDDSASGPGQPGAGFLEAFTEFREWYLNEMASLGDTTPTTTNQGDIELIDKIIELERLEVLKNSSGSASSSSSVPPPSIPAPSANPKKPTLAKRKAFAGKGSARKRVAK